MERQIIRVPARLYDEWEDALRKELKHLYPDDYKQLLPVAMEIEKENFLYQGHIFVRAGE